MSIATDAQIEACYRNFDAVIHLYSSKSGAVELTFPHAGECDFLDSTQYNGFIVYDTGKIAFDYWMPERLYAELCMRIRFALN